MTRNRNAHRRQYRSQPRRQTSDHSIVGSLSLEAIAVVALIIMLSVSGSENQPAQSRPDERVADRTSQFGSMISGFFLDQMERSQRALRN